jgi:GTP-binding protein
MFDIAEIRVKAGDGGDGAIGFRREKFVPFGGPDGGDGGRGGNILIRADSNVDSLRHYRQHRLHRAENGGAGGGNKMHGKDGRDLVLAVPPGTIVASRERDGTDALLADLARPGEEEIVARGGRGGLGNTRYVSSVNQSPRIAQRGEVGEEKSIRLEMRLIADAGIIGFPNAGKSTLLAAASAARPKIASYPFTTLEPVLGAVQIGLESFVLAEIPGLIEDAHRGKGLGHDFLRHAMRTRVLVHLVDGSSGTPGKDLETLNAELALFDAELARKPQIVAVNKIDLPQVKERLKAIASEFDGAGVMAHYISAARGDGVPELMREVLGILASVSGKEAVSPPVRVFRPVPQRGGVKVSRQGYEYVISAPGLERIKGGMGITASELRGQLNYLLQKMGVSSRLKKMGARPGDKIRCGEHTWEL